MADTTTLESLVGEHVLTAVEFDTDPRRDEWSGPANAIYFTLDGVTYKVTEDPDDGYRSSMRDIEVSDRVLSNTFEACRVVARYITGKRHDNDYSYGNDLLECIDTTTGKVVLAVGTENCNDYY